MLDFLIYNYRLNTRVVTGSSRPASDALIRAHYQEITFTSTILLYGKSLLIRELTHDSTISLMKIILLTRAIVECAMTAEPGNEFNHIPLILLIE